MRQPMTVEMDDDTTYEIDADARDIRAWEATYGESWFTTRISFTSLAQLAYIAGRRTGVLNGAWPDYETFDAHCTEARARRDEPLVADPTPPDRTDVSSARSRSGSTRSRPPSKPKARP